jgi:thiosulfate/3-mercaptopyruvate sulfurtransferase
MFRRKLATNWFLAITMLALGGLGCGDSQPSGENIRRVDLIVDGAWLESRLNDPEVRILDARFVNQEFEDAHIPGAQRLEPYQVASTIDAIPAQVTPRAIAAPLLEGLGLQPEDTIVVYGLAPEYDPARVVWALRYYGYPDVRYLDGGWSQWQAEARPTASGPASVVGGGTLPASIDENLRVDGDWILEQLGPTPYLDTQIQIIDARSPGEYLAGRIPTAIDRRWSINLNEGLVLPESDLQELYAGLDKQKTTVVYCLAGWRASLSWMVLKSLGFRDVRVYDGSWFEWGPPSPFPIETTE